MPQNAGKRVPEFASRFGDGQERRDGRQVNGAQKPPMASLLDALWIPPLPM